uniref:Immunoglobulin like and fibronectin type III domain containing 1, tandem duplicate 2 n=1 Tax=Dicentrarchus labrax TaxID=13489 RepID=A0A8P4GG26_DICLA
ERKKAKMCHPSVAIKKRSRVPGVMITQYVEQLPAGKSTPDFTRKPMATTVQEGKKAFFKAMVSGEPLPTVTWGRNKGQVDDPEKYKTRFEERAQEHILEVHGVKPDQADTYKCFATNEYGQAVCTVTLNVIGANAQDPQDFRSMLKKTKKQLPPKKEGEIDPKLWELLLCAPKKDYEKICFDFGVTDFRWMLKRLSQMKKERQDEQAKVVEKLDNVKQIEVTPSGRAEFSMDMALWDPNSAINLFKDGKMVSYGDDENSKHSLKKTGTKYVFSIKDPQPEDAGFYQVDVEDANVLTTDFQVPAVEFIAKIKDVKAFENEDATFQCVLSTPLNRITWSKQDSSLEHGDKYEITVSEDKLIHTLRVKGCEMADKGAYYAIAGIASSSASLTVEDPMSKPFKVNMPETKSMDFQSPPSFIVPLKRRTAPLGYECNMSCAVKGDPAPRVTWYRNNISLNTNTNYHITNVCGVCSMLILRVGPKDNGEYKIVIENKLGTAESSMTLNVRGIKQNRTFFCKDTDVSM